MKRVIIIFVIVAVFLATACDADQIKTNQDEADLQEVGATPEITDKPTPRPTERDYEVVEEVNGELCVEIDVYVNNELMDVTVYKDESREDFDFAYNYSDFVLAQPILDFLRIRLELDEKNDLLILRSSKYGETKRKYSNNVKIVDDQVYISFSLFRMHTDGSLKQDDYSAMYLFTSDCERTDLPATLEECYAMLDEILSEEDIEYMKNCTEEDRIMMHFGFGMWIRNEWLYPTQSKLTKLFIKSRPIPMHIDDMSSIIIEGYHRYLNDEPCSLKDMVKWDYEEKNK